MKAVLLGPHGQLGVDVRSANERMNCLDLTLIGRDQVDLSDLAAARNALGALSFDVLINCASYHRTDEIESNAQQAMSMNGHLVQELAGLCLEKAARFVTISTDYVYGGQAKRTPLTEEDGVAPLSVYGLSKAFGESLAMAAYAQNTLILRVSSLFGVAGASGKGGNFVETMLRLAREKGNLRVVNDQIMAPTGTADVAEALLRLLNAEAPAGIYHVAGTGHTSWHGFASRIVERANLGHVPVEAVPTLAFPTPAKRPPYSVLASGKLAATIGWSMPAWEDALDRYLIAKGHRAA